MSKIIYMDETIQQLGRIDAELTQTLIDSSEVVHGEVSYLVSEDSIDDIDVPFKRTLINGETSEELSEPHTLNIITRCPTKWVLQDLETGQIYRGTNSTEIKSQWKEIVQDKQPRK